MSPLLKIQDPQEPGEGLGGGRLGAAGGWGAHSQWPGQRQGCFPTEGLWVRSWHGGAPCWQGQGRALGPRTQCRWATHPPRL